MTQKRITGYTQDEDLKNDVQRTVNNSDTWNSESELVIHAVRKLLGEREAEEKAAEYNVERRIERKIDEMDRTVEQTVRNILQEQLDPNNNNSTNTAELSDEAVDEDKQDESASDIEWANRDDDGDWR
jgi:Arc/MetJ-type ribon-helix-helix transcriptional regulator